MGVKGKKQSLPKIGTVSKEQQAKIKAEEKAKERLTTDLDLKIWLVKQASRDHCWIIYQRWEEILEPVREQYPDLQLHTVYAAHVEPKSLSAIVADTQGQYHWINSNHVEVEASDDEEEGTEEESETGEESGEEQNEASADGEGETDTEGKIERPAGDNSRKGGRKEDGEQNASTEEPECKTLEIEVEGQTTKQRRKQVVEVYVTSKKNLLELLMAMKISDRAFLCLPPELRTMKLTPTDRRNGAKRVGLMEGLDRLRLEYVQAVVAALGEEEGHQSLGEIGVEERLASAGGGSEEREALQRAMRRVDAIKKATIEANRRAEAAKTAASITAAGGTMSSAEPLVAGPEAVEKVPSMEEAKEAQAEVDRLQNSLQTAIEKTQTELRARREAINKRLESVSLPEGVGEFWRAWMDYALQLRCPVGSKRSEVEQQEEFILDLGDLVSLPAAFLMALPRSYDIRRLVINQNYQLVRNLRWTDRFNGAGTEDDQETPSVPLQELTLANCGELDNAIIEQLVARLPELFQFGLHLCPRPNFRFFMALMKLEKLENVILQQPDLTCQTNAYFGVLKEEEWQSAQSKGLLRAPLKKLLINSRNLTLDVLDNLLRYCPKLERVVLDHQLWTKLQKSFIYADNDTKGKVTFATFNGALEFTVQRPFKLTNLMKDSYQEPFSEQMSAIAANVIANEDCGLEELNYEELRELEEEVLRELEAEEAAEAAKLAAGGEVSASA